MDPSALIDEGSFSNANAASQNLMEIWQFPATGAGEFGGGLGLRRMQFGDVLGENRDASANDPMSLDRVPNHGGARKRRDFENDSAKGVSTSNDNVAIVQNDCGGKRLKRRSGSGDENPDSKAEAEPNSGKRVEQNTRPQSEPPKQDYIHVRARRGQATDSHSLAERARREKIGERMTILQDLVPGCNKVIGKALVLDEIINYVQSLQHQVEFLSMKLEVVNSRRNPSIEVFASQNATPGYTDRYS